MRYRVNELMSGNEAIARGPMNVEPDSLPVIRGPRVQKLWSPLRPTLVFMRKEDGGIIINTEELYPPAVNLEEASYPSDAIETVKSLFPKVKAVDATALAMQAGNIRAVNTVLLGTLSASLSIAIEM